MPNGSDTDAQRMRRLVAFAEKRLRTSPQWVSEIQARCEARSVDFQSVLVNLLIKQQDVIRILRFQQGETADILDIYFRRGVLQEGQLKRLMDRLGKPALGEHIVAQYKKEQPPTT
jgi:hypothetical protein